MQADAVLLSVSSWRELSSGGCISRRLPPPQHGRWTSASRVVDHHAALLLARLTPKQSSCSGSAFALPAMTTSAQANGASSSAAYGSETSDRRIFIIHDADLARHPIDRFQCVPLIHPKHGKPCRYLLIEDRILEIQLLHDPQQLTSAFIDDYVLEDGCLHLATRIDTLFLALPLLVLARRQSAEHPGYFNSFAAIFNDPQRFPSHLFPAALPSTVSLLSAVCDTASPFDETLYRLNTARTVQWLTAKARRVQAVMGDDAAAAVDIIAEWIDDEWLSRLCEAMAVTPEQLSKTRKAAIRAAAAAGGGAGGGGGGEGEETETEAVGADAATERPRAKSGKAAPVKKKETLSLAARQLQQVNTKGMKTMSSFFAKK